MLGKMYEGKKSVLLDTHTSGVGNRVGEQILPKRHKEIP